MAPVVDKHQRFKSFSQMTSTRLEIRPATLKMPLLVISKLMTISSNCGLPSSASQHTIVQFIILNEINGDASIAAHLFIGPKINGQQNLTSR